MDARQAAEEAIARAICEWDGLDWDEERARSTGPDGETGAMPYWYTAETALDALLAPRRVSCKTCERTRAEALIRGQQPPACPDCEDGTVPAEPLAVLSAEYERIKSMHAEAFRIGIGWQERCQAAEAEVERLRADLPKYEQVEGLVYDPESHIPNQPVHWPGLSCTAHDGYPACVPVFVRVPAPSEEDK
jgi:hypothetical protein